jgi:DNA invertase Pin-like site-specific DNA recombinase
MKMTARPYAYIRKSTVGGADSKSDQIADVRGLAAAVDPESAIRLQVLDGDWAISARREKVANRHALAELLTALEAGEVSALYAKSLDRIARDVESAARILNACERAHVPIHVLIPRKTFEAWEPMDRMLFHYEAIRHEQAVDADVAKASQRVTRQRERGSKLGPAFYGALPGESLETVLATFERTGSSNRTALELNRIGLPTRRGGEWTHASVRQILAREGRLPALRVRGAKPQAPHIFYRLLRCHCGRILSGARRPEDAKRHGGTMYRCVNAEAIPLFQHGKKSISEDIVLRWAKKQTARLRPPKEPILIREGIEAERAALQAKRERVLVNFEDGHYTREERDERLRPIESKLAALDEQGQAIMVPGFTWHDPIPPIETNAALRALWREVQLGPDMTLPDEPDWLAPREWLA